MLSMKGRRAPLLLMSQLDWSLIWSLQCTLYTVHVSVYAKTKDKQVFALVTLPAVTQCNFVGLEE